MNKELREERFAGRRSKFRLFTYEIGRRTKHTLFGHFKFKKVLQSKTKETIFVWTMLAIPILNFLVFWLYVNFDSILLAFKNIDYTSGEEYWTLENFKMIYKMFTEKTSGTDLAHYGLNTLKYWSLSVFWGIPHSILLTYVLQKKLAGHKFFRVVLYLPSIICGVVIAGIFESFISGNGAFGYVLTNVFDVARVPAWFQETEYATKMLLFYAFFFGFAGNYVLLSGAMAQIPTEVTEAALLEGVGMWQELWYVDIPMMWSTISMLIVTSFAGIFGASGAILLFTSNLSSTWTFGYWIFDQVRTYNSYYVPAALGLVFTIIAFPILLLVRKIVTNIYQYDA